MPVSNPVTQGMTISLGNRVYRVESTMKVTVAKGNPFIRVKLKDLSSGQLVERNFKVDQSVKDVSLTEKRLEFLYPENGAYLFLDIDSLEHVLVAKEVIGESHQYLKEGVEIKAAFWGEKTYAVELPQFLELMVAKTAMKERAKGQSSKVATLETGANVEVPPFIEAGDIIKVDTKTREYIQRV